jgi:hypothetical protein
VIDMGVMRLVLLILLWVMAVPPSHVQAQSALSGQVVDARTQQPLAGVVVSIEGLPAVTSTDGEGRFRIETTPGRHVVSFRLIGYALRRESVELGTSAVGLHVQLSEGTGDFEEHVTVAGSLRRESDEAPGGAALYGRELQSLRGLTLDDPLRAVQALPSTTATDDFYSEFAVRGSPFRQIGLTLDGVPTRYLMHTIHGATDGGSIAIVNSEALGAVTLLPGGYPQRSGRRLGALLTLATRDGSRERVTGRAGLSGTSANALIEGPLARGRGSWLVSARRSYLDFLISRIDPDGSFGFGFTDGIAKLSLDLSPRNQIQWLGVVGRSVFDEDPEELGVNEDRLATSRTWLSALTWRFTPSPRFSVSQRIYTTGVDFRHVNRQNDVLNDGRSHDLGWRADGTLSIGRPVVIEFGGDAQRLTGRGVHNRAVNDAPALMRINEYSQAATAISAYAMAGVSAGTRLTITPGIRVDAWRLTRETAASPWLTADVRLTDGTRFRAGGGLYRQFADLDQAYGLRGGGTSLRAETATHLDLGISQRLGRDTTLHVTWYARQEDDVLWPRGGEPRRLSDGTIAIGRADAPWVNGLDGRARGLEVTARRDAPTGLSGWVGYAYGRHRYGDAATGERFDADFDQRHTVTAYGHYRVSPRSTIGAKFRYGSNYPLAGYIGRQSAGAGTPQPPLFGGSAVPLFYQLVDERNRLRLPAYARLDIRADRTFTWSSRRVVLFAEVANTFNRRNERNVPYGVDGQGRVMGATDSLMPIVPSAGLVVEF